MSFYAVLDTADKAGRPYLQDAATWQWVKEPHYFATWNEAVRQLTRACDRLPEWEHQLEIRSARAPRSEPLSSSDFAPPTERSPAAESTPPPAVRGEDLPRSSQVPLSSADLIGPPSVDEPCVCELIFRARTWQVANVKLRLAKDAAQVIGITTADDDFLHADEARALSVALTEAADALEGRAEDT